MPCARLRSPLPAALLLLVLLVALAGCGGGPRVVPLEELAANPDAFDGQIVSTSGHVRPIRADVDAGAEHFVIEDREHNRVRLLPDSAARPHAGRFVRVVGRFAFDETTGRRLLVEEIGVP